MSRPWFWCAAFCLAANVLQAAEGDSSAPAAQAEAAVQTSPAGQMGAKTLSGMSVLGNNEAPKSLVIVPWKTAELGEGIGIADMLDERLQPVDPDVFARQLRYYELRHGKQHGPAAPH